MFYAYVLRSLKDKELYVGSTNDLKNRLSEHNSGLVRSTKSRTPFKLVYYEAFLSEKEARYREKRLKYRGQARRQLLERIKESIVLASK